MTNKNDFIEQFLSENSELMERLSKLEEKDTPQNFAKKFKKSYDFRDHGVGISVADQHIAEQTSDPKLLNFLRSKVMNLKNSDTVTYDFAKGQLTLAQKDANLFNGFYKDQDGQIIEKFDDKTIELVAKALLVKNLAVDFAEPDEAPVEEYAEVAAPAPSTGTYMRIKCGDFEFEMKKSLEAALKDKSSRDSLKKSLKIFRKSSSSYTNLKDDKDTVRELLANWDIHSERFNQIVFAVDQVKKARK